MSDPNKSLAERIREAAEHAEVAWSTLVVGEDHVAEMKRMSLNLVDQEASPTGDGRFIDCSHAYWGVGPTISWHRACGDPSYLVGRRSAESFEPRWRALCPNGTSHLPSAFVSLGPGTGEKDIVVLGSLPDPDEEPCYIPVDMSAEMLRLHLEAHGESSASLRHMIAIKLDFSIPTNVRALRIFLDGVLGADTPILFSLVGNTLANFTEDQHMLNTLVEDLMTHERDLLLLELATSSVIDQDAAKMVEREYRGSPLFLNWVTSALATHTDIGVDQDAVKFLPSVEEDRALVLKVVYTNTTDDATNITLADGSSFRFQVGDTIRLELTRKYHPDAINALLDQASMAVCARHGTELSGEYGAGKFGLELLLASRNSGATRATAGSRRALKVFPISDD